MSTDSLTGKLIGMLAHDLRTPLSSVLLHLELLEGAEGLTADEREDIGYALRSGRALAELIAIAVDAIRGVGASPADHDLAAFVRQAVESADSGGTTRAVEVHAPETLVARLDPALTLRALRQMLQAADAATPSEEVVRVRLRSNGARARVEVVDSGETIPEPLRERLFEPAGAVEIRTEHRHLSRGIGPIFCRRVAEDADRHPSS